MRRDLFKKIGLILFISIGVVRFTSAEQIDGKDIEAIYKVKFHYEGFEEERNIAFKFFFKEEGKYMPWFRFKHVGVDVFDVDQDGELEIFAYVNGEGMCPRAGCPFAILKKNKNSKEGYTVLPWGGGIFTLSGYHSPFILKDSHNGYYDLVFGGISDTDLHIWRWNGKEYR